MRVKNEDLKESIHVFFEQYCEEKGYAPTVREVSREMCITVNKAYRYLLDLQSEGLIIKEKGFVSKTIANKNEELHIKILNQDKYISIPKTLLSYGNYYFIVENDILFLIDSNKTPTKGNLVAATDGDNTFLGTLITDNTVKLRNKIKVNVKKIIGVAIKELRDI